ncbi:MAG: protein kinase [Planctomycetaceae bacterium]|nr:protein kinase [Planctomycetaceae bacterium]
MSSPEVSELCRVLLRLQLVTQQQVEDALADLSYNQQTPRHLIQLLQQRNLLTSYQAGQLLKDDQTGLRLGNYLLLYHNGSGSFSRVFRARSIVDGSMVGLKVLRRRWTEDPKLVAQFRREAQQGKLLRHENIVPIYEVGEDDDQMYLTMEFIEGGNLRDFINIRKKLSPLEAARIIFEICLGLNYALSKGLTHRDMKMTNVLITSKGTAKLVDFGLAVAQNLSPYEEAQNETAQRALEYATLEKGSGAPRDDPRSDLYFVGAIMYELLTGVSPFGRTRDRNERSKFSRYSQIRPISTLDPEVPKSVVRVVERLMQVNPTMRYQTPGEVLLDLQSVIVELDEMPKVKESVAAATNNTTQKSYEGVVMCVEDRTKRQDLLRDYFSKKNYRVMFFSDFLRAIQRLPQVNPDCLIVMGDTVRDRIPTVFNEIQQTVVGYGIPAPVVLLVLAGWQSDWRGKLAESRTNKVLSQPVTLRDLHARVKEAVADRQ